MRATRYNPRKQMMVRGRVVALLLVVACVGAALFHADAATDREQQVAALSKQIAAIAGPGPANLSIQNRSSISPDEISAIRTTLERDLRGYGVIVSTAGSATAIRITLSENAAGGLWIAEVQEGTQTRVTMLPADLGATAQTQTAAGITLRKTLIWQQKEQILDVLAVSSGAAHRMLVLEPERVVSYATAATGIWTKEQEFSIAHARPFPRDMRGRLVAGQGHLFDAYLPGVICAGTESDGSLTMTCADSDDPWPLSAGERAFYNATRNYFTGALAPGFAMQMQPFYAAADLPRPNGQAMLFDGIDGKVVMIENNLMKPVAGARDWGSDLASIHSSCGAGTQVLVSASGAAPADSARAYEIPGREAEPVSAPLAFDGQVMAMWPSSDGASATVVVRATDYEVYGVSAICN